MKTPQQFIEELTFDQKVQIINDFEMLKNEVKNDDSELYKVAKNIATEYDLPVSVWLDSVGNMVAISLAKEYINYIQI